MSEPIFPVQIPGPQRYTMGGDAINRKLNGSIGNLYRSTESATVIKTFDTSNVTYMDYMFYDNTNLVTITPMNTSNVTSMNNMFQNCKSLIKIPQLDTSNVTSMNNMFYGCNSLIKIPQLDTSNVTSMNNMFYNCNLLREVPYMNTSNVKNMNYMFYGCNSLHTIPEFDFSGVSGSGALNNMFYNCYYLSSVPDMNTKNVTTFSNTFTQCYILHTIGRVACDSLTSIQGFINTSYSLSSLVNFGGFINLGAKTSLSGSSGNYGLYMMPNLSHESLLNVLNGLYDRASAGYSVITLKLHPNHHAKLTEDEIAIATNKGWTIS